MVYEELLTDLLRAEREEKTNPRRYTFVVKSYFSGAVPDWARKTGQRPVCPQVPPNDAATPRIIRILRFAD